MASVLKSYDFAAAKLRGGNKNGVRYPWDLWLDGKIRRLRRGDGKGKDFDVAPHSLLHVGYTAAKGRGLKLRSSVEDDNTVVIQAVQGGE